MHDGHVALVLQIAFVVYSLVALLEFWRYGCLVEAPSGRARLGALFGRLASEPAPRCRVLQTKGNQDVAS